MLRFFLFVGLLCSFSQGQNSDFDLIKLYGEPGAVCNDGSPAAVYFSPSNSCGGRKWVIHLQGGYWCWDEESCTEREQNEPYYVSSNSYAPTMTRSTGLFSRNSTKNPDFYDYNFVYVMYCSSDQFAGDGVSTVNGEQWQFRGKNIISGVVNYFISKYGLVNAQEILWSGCSAGGQGVLNTIDQAAVILSQNGYAGKFKGMADAGWMSQFLPITGNIPMGSQLTLGYELWNGSVTSCTASNPGFESVCYLSQFGSSHLKTPTLFQCQQYDQFQTSYNCCNPPFTSENMIYLDSMRDAYQHSYEVLGEEFGVYSAACYWHCSTEDDTFTTIQINHEGEDLSLQQVLGNFFHKEENRGPTNVVDKCEGYSCSVNCPSS